VNDPGSTVFFHSQKTSYFLFRRNFFTSVRRVDLIFSFFINSPGGLWGILSRTGWLFTPSLFVESFVPPLNLM